MSGTHLEVRLSDLVGAAARDIMRDAANSELALRSIGETMLPRIDDRFKKEQGPDGKSWARLAPATIRYRLKRYGNSPLTILRMRGHLAGSINYQVQGNVLRIGTGREVEHYAGIHQHGGQAGRGRKVTIPARPFLGFGDEDLEIVDDELLEFFSPGGL